MSAEIEKKLNDILAKVFPKQAWEITPYAQQGASANIIKLTSAQHTLLARISDPGRPGANIPLEYVCLKQASELGIAPNVVYADDGENIAIMDYVQSQSPETIVSELDVAKLASTIAVLHDSKALPESHSIFDMINMIGGAIGPVFNEYEALGAGLKLVEQYAPTLNVKDDKRPSHRDLHVFNVLLNEGNYYLIDWESAGNESFYFDLAVVYNMIINVSHTCSAEKWLTAYFSRKPTGDELKKFAIMRVVILIHYGLLCIYLSTAFGEARITPDEFQALPAYTTYIKQQIAADNPDLNGQYLKIGGACLQAALVLNESI